MIWLSDKEMTSDRPTQERVGDMMKGKIKKARIKQAIIQTCKTGQQVTENCNVNSATFSSLPDI